ncbi:response regulator transcription factor [Paenibacillus albicereus]|uniref:Response regulator transcription factor n=1 Tax=Paenibacillus albicereus TaxID=2726185 RepID=A0A6H2GUA0_9BACL|nr:LytTR family DNA-binding domain-containing protein [Paenibacillus albicereus]QJC50746.1 response regulator transcription factor [Paenibacillus albicereus]
MLKAYLVEDEPLARDELAYLLRRTRKVELVGEAETAEEALLGIEAAAPDVVFLDIELSETSGLDVARRLRQLERPPAVVFATAYDEHALQAFDLDAADYILKPYDEERIRQTIDKLSRRLEASAASGAGAAGGGGAAPSPAAPGASAPSRTGKLAVAVDERIVLLPVGDILYLASEEGKTRIALADGRAYVSAEPLVAFEQKLQGTPIQRVHRAFLVHVDAIAEIQPWFHSTCTLILRSGDKVPVSRTHLKELKQRLGW